MKTIAKLVIGLSIKLGVANNFQSYLAIYHFEAQNQQGASMYLEIRYLLTMLNFRS